MKELLFNIIDYNNIKQPLFMRIPEKRNICDFYATPMNTIQSVLDCIDLSKYNNILEPSAGNGNICNSLRSNGYNGRLTACEIRSSEYNNLSNYTDNIIIGDLLTLDTNQRYDLIIGNPPFNLALEIIEKCFDLLTENGELLFLLRTAFLESKSRYEFWQRHPLSGLFVLSQSHSFTGKGTDATSYSWFLFKKNFDGNQQIRVLK